MDVLITGQRCGLGGVITGSNWILRLEYVFNDNKWNVVFQDPPLRWLAIVLVEESAVLYHSLLYINMMQTYAVYTQLSFRSEILILL